MAAGVANTVLYRRSDSGSSVGRSCLKQSKYFRPTFGQNIGLAYS